MPEPRATTRREQAVETRGRIFAAALTLFEKNGYDGVTVDDICAAVGMSKGAFYTHFGSKDQVLLEEFMRTEGLYDEILDEIACVEDGIEKLRRFWESSLERIENMGVGVVKVVFHAEIGPSRKESFISSKKRPVFAAVERLLGQAQAADLVRDDMSAAQLADSAVSCWRGLVYDWCLAEGGFGLKSAGSRVFELLYNGFGKA